MLKDTVRKFVDREMIPIERTARDGHKLKPEVRAASDRQGAASLVSPATTCRRSTAGSAWGCRQGDSVGGARPHHRAAIARRRRVRAATSARSSITWTTSRSSKYLLPTIRGELNWCLAQTEPDAGGDPGGMRTTAVRQGDHYVINGIKRFITGADEADYAQLIAATDRTKGSRGGISAFIVDMKAPGVRLLRSQELVVDDRPWEIAFEDVKVPVGEPHRRGGRRLQACPALAQRRPHPPRRAQHRRDRALPRARRAATPSSASPSASRWPSGRRCSGCWPTASWNCTSFG